MRGLRLRSLAPASLDHPENGRAWQVMKHRRAVYGKLLRHRFAALEAALRPGLESVSWASAHVGRYLDGLEAAILRCFARPGEFGYDASSH